VLRQNQEDNAKIVAVQKRQQTGETKESDRKNAQAAIEIRCYYTYILVCMYLIDVSQYVERQFRDTFRNMQNMQIFAKTSLCQRELRQSVFIAQRRCTEIAMNSTFMSITSYAVC